MICYWYKFPAFSSLSYRINQLVDILALWAFTSNFSTVQVPRLQFPFRFPARLNTSLVITVRINSTSKP
jgi:hypothetical protein